jgi:hypothetical protein
VKSLRRRGSGVRWPREVRLADRDVAEIDEARCCSAPLGNACTNDVDRFTIFVELTLIAARDDARKAHGYTFRKRRDP